MATEHQYLSISYKMYVLDEYDKWDLWQTVTAQKPLNFVSGMDMVLDGFEKYVLQLKNGDGFDFALTPEQAYGEYVEEAHFTVPRSTFEIDGILNKKYVYEGAVVPLKNADGESFNGTITEINPIEITVDLNHPLAGETLRFVGEVLESHKATVAEMEKMAKMIANECGGFCGDCKSGCAGCKGDC